MTLYSILFIQYIYFVNNCILFLYFDWMSLGFGNFMQPTIETVVTFFVLLLQKTRITYMYVKVCSISKFSGTAVVVVLVSFIFLFFFLDFLISFAFLLNWRIGCWFWDPEIVWKWRLWFWFVRSFHIHDTSMGGPVWKVSINVWLSVRKIVPHP